MELRQRASNHSSLWKWALCRSTFCSFNNISYYDLKGRLKDKIKIGTNLTFIPVDYALICIYFHESCNYFKFLKDVSYGRPIVIEYLKKLEFGVSRSAKCSDFDSNVRKTKVILTAFSCNFLRSKYCVASCLYT